MSLSCLVDSFLEMLMSRGGGFPSDSAVKDPPARQELQQMWVRSPSPEDPLEEEMATHSSILAWRIPWTEKPTGL